MGRIKRFFWVGCALTFGAAMLTAYDPAVDDPAWWSGPVTGIYEGGAAPASDFDHHAPVTIGQLKNVAAQAKAVLDQELAAIGGAGLEIDALVASFTMADPENYAPANVGQLKAVSAKFFERFAAIGFDSSVTGWPATLVLNDTSLGVTDNSPLYPWLDDQTPENSSPANIGQLKHLFSWDISTFAASDLTQIDADADGLPDAWEQFHELDPSSSEDATEDPDLDGLANISEFNQQRDPNYRDHPDLQLEVF